MSTRRPPSRARVGAALFALVGGVVQRGRGEMSLTAISTLATLDRTGPRRITDLATAEAMTQPSMTKLVTALEQSGFVERRGDPTDKRVALVVLTATGAEYLKTKRRAGASAFVDLLDKLPDAEADTLLAALPALEHLLALDDEQRDPPPR